MYYQVWPRLIIVLKHSKFVFIKVYFSESSDEESEDVRKMKKQLLEKDNEIKALKKEIRDLKGNVSEHGHDIETN